MFSPEKRDVALDLDEQPADSEENLTPQPATLHGER